MQRQEDVYFQGKIEDKEEIEYQGKQIFRLKIVEIISNEFTIDFEPNELKVAIIQLDNISKDSEDVSLLNVGDTINFLGFAYTSYTTNPPKVLKIIKLKVMEKSNG